MGFIVIRLSHWFRVKLWLAVKCMAFANWILRMRPSLAERAGIDPMSDTELDMFHKELLQHTSEVRH